MVQQLLAVIAPLLLGAQIVLTLVLVKGEICPGQRGRVHKMLPTLAILWLAVASLKIQAFMVAAALVYFYSQVQTNKTRERGPLWVLYLANGLALAYVGIMIGEQPTAAAGANVVMQVFLLGACFSQLLLIIARSRLQAFQRILPITGVVSAMLASLTVLWSVYGLPEAQLQSIMMPIVSSLGLMLAAALIWCVHLFVAKPATKAQLSLTLLMLLSAALFAQPIFSVMS
ncbi:hypothetical protein H2O73_11935 [Vibrio sp. 404]|uniref:Dimethyl sulfoxide reductase n=1 Tax=Vibrio marinisediminis TaxID=2758441 RepID=A0A7W2FRQ4_9VIBR|nr:hypothetical protein [Vibrio marinisediminis]MBA5763061.1 hypothetical protein [Vibrio marinisediminis]